jgi:hypothetical protein
MAAEFDGGVIQPDTPSLTLPGLLTLDPTAVDMAELVAMGLKALIRDGEWLYVLSLTQDERTALRKRFYRAIGSTPPKFSNAPQFDG